VSVERVIPHHIQGNFRCGGENLIKQKYNRLNKPNHPHKQTLIQGHCEPDPQYRRVNSVFTTILMHTSRTHCRAEVGWKHDAQKKLF